MYATLADILEQLPESDLIGLTDDIGVGEVDRGPVDRAIADAASLIDSYTQIRYPSALSPVVPPAIRRIAVDLAIYDLYSRRSLDCPEIRKDRHRAAIRLLEQIADGRISLGVATSDPVGENLAVMEGGGREFTGPRSLRGF